MGCRAAKRLILSPPTELADGSKVRVTNPSGNQDAGKQTASR